MAGLSSGRLKTMWIAFVVLAIAVTIASSFRPRGGFMCVSRETFVDVGYSAIISQPVPGTSVRAFPDWAAPSTYSPGQDWQIGPLKTKIIAQQPWASWVDRKLRLPVFPATVAHMSVTYLSLIDPKSTGIPVAQQTDINNKLLFKPLTAGAAVPQGATVSAPAGYVAPVTTTAPTVSATTATATNPNAPKPIAGLPATELFYPATALADVVDYEPIYRNSRTGQEIRESLPVTLADGTRFTYRDLGNGNAGQRYELGQIIANADGFFVYLGRGPAANNTPIQANEWRTSPLKWKKLRTVNYKPGTRPDPNVAVATATAVPTNPNAPKPIPGGRPQDLYYPASVIPNDGVYLPTKFYPDVNTTAQRSAPINLPDGTPFVFDSFGGNGSPGQKLRLGDVITNPQGFFVYLRAGNNRADDAGFNPADLTNPLKFKKVTMRYT